MNNSGCDANEAAIKRSVQEEKLIDYCRQRIFKKIALPPPPKPTTNHNLVHLALSSPTRRRPALVLKGCSVVVSLFAESNLRQV